MGTEEFDNDEFVNARRSFAITQPLQLAIRELHSIAGSLRFWAGLAAVVVVLAVAAPFDTAAHFAFPTLLVYWGAIAVATFFIAVITCVTVCTWCQQIGLPCLFGGLAGGAVSGLPVTLFVVAFNRVFFDIDPVADHGLGGFLFQCMLITMAIFTIFRLVNDRENGSVLHHGESDPEQGGGVHDGSSEVRELTTPPVTDTATPRTLLHQRLSLHLGDDIVSIQAQDHYVDVTTSEGHELILMRLVDAERELQGLPGIRVHRSWWVAESHTTAIKRQDNRVMVLLDTGSEVPVSRSRVSALHKVLSKRDNRGE